MEIENGKSLDLVTRHRALGYWTSGVDHHVA